METKFLDGKILLHARFKYDLHKEVVFPEQVTGVIHFDPKPHAWNPEIKQALRHSGLKYDLKKCGQFEKERRMLMDLFHRKFLTEKAYRYACKRLLREIQNHVWEQNYVARISKLDQNQQYATRKR